MVKRTPFRFTREHLVPVRALDRIETLATLDREARSRCDAGVGEDDVEPSRRRDDVGDQRLDLALVGDVDHVRARVRSALDERGRDALEPLAVEVGQRHTCSALREHLGDRVAESARRARDDGTRAANVEEPLLHARRLGHGTRTARPGDLAFPELVEHVVHLLERMRLGAKRDLAADMELEELPQIDPVADEVPGDGRLPHHEADGRMRDGAPVTDDGVEASTRKHLHRRLVGRIGPDEVEHDVGTHAVRRLAHGVGDIGLLAQHLVCAELAREAGACARPCRSR